MFWDWLYFKLGNFLKLYKNFKILYLSRKTRIRYNTKINISSFIIKTYNWRAKFIFLEDSMSDLFSKSFYKYNYLLTFEQVSQIYYNMRLYFWGYTLAFTRRFRDMAKRRAHYTKYRWFEFKRSPNAWLNIHLILGLSSRDMSDETTNKFKYFEKARKPWTILNVIYKHTFSDVLMDFKRIFKSIYNFMVINTTFEQTLLKKEKKFKQRLPRKLNEEKLIKYLIWEIYDIYDQYGWDLSEEEEDALYDLGIDRMSNIVGNYMVTKNKIDLNKVIRDFDQVEVAEVLDQSEVKYSTSFYNFNDVNQHVADELLKFDSFYNFNFMKGIAKYIKNIFQENISYMKYPKEDLKDAKFYNPFDLLGFQDVSFFYKIKNRWNYEVNLKSFFDLVRLNDITPNDQYNKWWNSTHDTSKFIKSKDLFFLKIWISKNIKNFLNFWLDFTKKEPFLYQIISESALLSSQEDEIDKKNYNSFVFILIDYFFIFIEEPLNSQIKDFFSYLNLNFFEFLFYPFFIFDRFFIILMYIYLFVLFLCSLRLLFLIIWSIIFNLIYFFNNLKLKKQEKKFKKEKQAYNFYEFYNNKFSNVFNYKNSLSLHKFINDFKDKKNTIFNIILQRKKDKDLKSINIESWRAKAYKELDYKYKNYEETLNKFFQIYDEINLDKNKQAEYIFRKEYIYNKNVDIKFNKYSMLKELLPTIKYNQNSISLSLFHRRNVFIKKILKEFAGINYPNFMQILDRFFIRFRDKQNIIDNSELHFIWDYYNAHIFEEPFFKVNLKDLAYKTKPENLIVENSITDCFNVLFYKHYSKFNISKKSWFFRYDTNLEYLNLTKKNQAFSNLNFYTLDWYRSRTNFLDLKTSKKKKKIYLNRKNFLFSNSYEFFNYMLYLLTISFVFYACLYSNFFLYFVFCILGIYFYLIYISNMTYEEFFIARCLQYIINIFYFYSSSVYNFFKFLLYIIIALYVIIIAYQHIPLYWYTTIIIHDIDLIEFFNNLLNFFLKKFTFTNFTFENLKIHEIYLWIFKFSIFSNGFSEKLLWRKPFSLSRILREFYLKGYKNWYEMSSFSTMLFPSYNSWFNFWKRPQPYYLEFLWTNKKKKREPYKEKNYWNYRFYENIRKLDNFKLGTTLTNITRIKIIWDSARRATYYSKIYEAFAYWHLSRLNRIFDLYLYKSNILFSFIKEIRWFFFFINFNYKINTIIYVYILCMFIFFLIFFFFLFFLFFFIFIKLLVTNELIFNNLKTYKLLWSRKFFYVFFENNIILKAFFPNLVLKYKLLNLKQKYKIISESNNLKYF